MDSTSHNQTQDPHGIWLPGRAREAIRDYIREILRRANAVNPNENRDTYAPWFKFLTVNLLKEDGVTYATISDLTGVPVKTMEKFKTFAEALVIAKEELSPTVNAIANAWRDAPTAAKSTLDSFWSYLGRNRPDLRFSFEEVRQALISLGLRYPRGPKIKNEGAQVQNRFTAQAMWGGDGKHLKIRINGEEFHSCWYAFIDHHTTLLTGRSFTPEESAKSLTNALDDGQAKTGSYPVGILIDNRLTEGERGAVMQFCDENGITVARTFPGSSKTNGIIEGNFSIYERFVGDINIEGEDNAALAASFMQAIIEIFTQMRNHSPRKRLGGKTPAEAHESSKRPEELKEEIEKIRDRFEKEEVDVETKFALVKDLLGFFGPLSSESLDKFKRILKTYSPAEIIAAAASYRAQRAKHPEKSYGAEYFLAILRNKREENGKRAYNEEFRAKTELYEKLVAEKLKPTANVDRQASLIHDCLVEAASQGVPTKLLLSLESLAWWLVDFSARTGIASLQKLWRRLATTVESSIHFPLVVWERINEFLYTRIGRLLNSRPPPHPEPWHMPSGHC